MKNIRETIKTIVAEESDYQQFFRKALEKTGKSIPDMSDEEKKAFFNKIDAAWDGKGEKNEGNAFGAAVVKAKEAGEDEFEVGGKTFKVESVNEVTLRKGLKLRMYLNGKSEITDYELVQPNYYNVVKGGKTNLFKVVNSTNPKIKVGSTEDFSTNDIKAQVKSGIMSVLTESVNEGKKRFYQQDGIGRAKYTISYHDGKSTHNDGSDFYGIKTFKNKIELEKFKNELLKNGYREDIGYKKESVNEKMDTMTKAQWNKTHKDYKSIKNGVHYVLKMTDKGTASVPVKIVEGVVGINESKFKVDDLVYNKRTKTVGIVRMGDDKYGEVKTDADGNVDVDELEKYNPIKNKTHQTAKAAPSTMREVDKRGLFNPFKNESINEVFKHIISIETPTQVLSKPIAAQIRALAKKGVRSKEIGLKMGFTGNEKLVTDRFQQVKNKIYFELDEVVNENASRTAMEIGGLTGLNKTAVQKFVDDNNLDIEKVFQFVKKGKLSQRMDFVTAVAGKPGNPIQKKLMNVFKESVNENFSTDDIAKIKGAVEGSTSFMGIGAELKKLGMKYSFSTEPLPLYMIMKGSKKYVLINKKYAESPDFVIGNTAGGLLESKSVNEGNPIKMNNLDWGKSTAERNANLDKYDLLKTDKEKNDFLRKLKGESVNEAKDDYSARHGKSNILLKKGYKHHTEDELEALYDKVGKLVKGLNVKDVNVVFEEVVNEGNAFGAAVTQAKKDGKTEFEFNGKTYKVKKGSYEKNEAAKKLAEKAAASVK